MQEQVLPHPFPGTKDSAQSQTRMHIVLRCGRLVKCLPLCLEQSRGSGINYCMNQHANKEPRVTERTLFFPERARQVSKHLSSNKKG